MSVSANRTSASFYRILIASFIATFAVVSCSGDGPFSEPTPTKDIDTFRTVSERYASGQPRYVSYSVGEDSITTEFLRRETYSPRGELLKIMDDSGVYYYHDVNPQFDSSKGLQEYLQGMWRRKEPVTKYRSFEVDGKRLTAAVKANVARTFRSDTLIMTRYATIYNPDNQKQIGKDIVEVGFKVSYQPPQMVSVEKTIYRRHPDSTQVLSRTPLIPAKFQGVITDTLRLYGPKRFRVMTSGDKTESEVYRRHLPLRRVPGSLPEELKRITQLD